MELWIRSQDNKNLIKVNALYTDIPSDFGKEGFGIYCDKRDNYISNNLLKIGTYKTKERTLEVLDEIAAMMKNRYIVKPSGILSTKDIANEHIRLKRLYNGEFIMENPPFEIEPINNNVIYYEMPEE
ncbi:MAG: hypothetical protein IKE89_02245 [Bacilli bacterium]|nr:hypothetical protein [Bacilli bacterium]